MPKFGTKYKLQAQDTRRYSVMSDISGGSSAPKYAKNVKPSGFDFSFKGVGQSGGGERSTISSKFLEKFE